MATPQLWPIFICYRRVDGIETARRIHDILDRWETTGPENEPIKLDVYLDEEMPGVENWKELHQPYLEKARAVIVICTPGAKLNEGADDYVHKEIDWWLKHREVAPILIDPYMAGSRFVPSQIVQSYPDIQRILLVEKEWIGLSQILLEEKTDALRRQIIGAILPSGAEIYAQELKRERQRTRELDDALTKSRKTEIKLRKALIASTILLVLALILGAYAFIQRNSAIKQKIHAEIATKHAEDAQARAEQQAEFARRGTYNIQLARASDLWQHHPSQAIALLNDTNRAASASGDGTIKLWDAQTRQERVTLTGHGGRVWSVAFSPNGKILASASVDQTIKLWGAQTGQVRATLTGHGDVVYSVAVSPDGKTLASASRDKTIKLWDAQTGQERVTLTGHGDEVYSVAFSPDGKTLASASVVKTIKLWDTQTGQERATLTGHDEEVFSVAFSPDGKTLASASGDDTIKLWDAKND